ncbi:MAG: peptide MFS transporter [Legionellales bacterium]|nr:peptide MFS transporter [Legionellales bacterium]
MLKKIPKGVLALSSVEMWERFSFYSMQALLVLYASATTLQGGLGWSEASALRLTAFYGSFMYVSPILGGILADRVLGRRNAVNLGAVLMCIGQLCLAFFATTGLYIGIALLIVGCGLLKPTISAMVGEFYTEHDRRREAAFTIFYMGINIGGTLGPFLAGSVNQHYGYHMGFFAGALGLVVALVSFAIANKNSLRDVGIRMKKKKMNLRIPQIVLTPLEKRRIKVYLTMCVGNIVWNIVYGLPYGLLTLYASKNIVRTLGSYTIPAEWYYGLYGVFIVALCPFLAAFYHKIADSEKQFTLSHKLAMGYFLVSIGCLILLPMVHNIVLNPTYQGSSWYLIGFYFFFSMSELLTVPVLLSAATRLAPKRYAAAMVSANMLISWAFGAYLAGEFSVLTINYNAEYLFWGIIAATVFFGILHLAFNRRVEALCQISDQPIDDLPGEIASER